MPRQPFRLRRGLLYGAGSALGGIALPGPALFVAAVGSGVTETCIAAFMWSAAVGVTGLVIGSCQPQQSLAATSIAADETASNWELARRCLYVLVVGSLIGALFAGVAVIGWFGVLLAIFDPAYTSRSLAGRAIISACGTAMGAAGIGAFTGSVLGAGLGSAAHMRDVHPPIARCAVWASVLSLVVASPLGAGLGAALPLKFGLAFTLALAAGAVAGIGGGLITWQLALRRTTG
jgi:hypothetical protein